jgi:general secretion pathway protein J
MGRNNSGFTPLRRSAQQGFTLVELMVALFIFGLLSAAGVALLSFSVRSQAAAEERLGELAQLRRAGSLLAGDLAQAAPRVSRDHGGVSRPAFAGGTGDPGAIALAFVRRGWENVEAAPRPSLQKVEYRLSGDRLERIAWPLLDGAAPLVPMTLVDGVRSLRLRYRDGQGQWRSRWDPSRATDLPTAVEMVLDAEGSGVTRQLFLAGTGR